MPDKCDDSVTKDVISSASAAGGLLAWLADNIAAVSESERDAVCKLVAGMHDAGEIDAVEALLGPGVGWDWTPEWLARQQVVRLVLPEITDSVAPFYSLSAIASGHWPIVAMACRHYRLPIPPHLWTGLLAGCGGVAAGSAAPPG